MKKYKNQDNIIIYINSEKTKKIYLKKFPNEKLTLLKDNVKSILIRDSFFSYKIENNYCESVIRGVHTPVGSLEY